jgi:hypothetical protein
MSKIHCITAAGLFLLLFSKNVLANNTEAAQPQTLVCNTQKVCSVSAARAKKFLAGFYRWYNAAIDGCYNDSFFGAGHRYCLNQLRNNVSLYLSKSFANRLDRIIEITDADPITCAQDGWDNLSLSPDVAILKMSSMNILAKVTLPFPVLKEGDASHVIQVKMEHADNKWLITDIHKMSSKK